MDRDIIDRKNRHLDICLNENVESGNTLFENVYFDYNSLPETNFSSIDLSVEFFGKKINAPIIIGSMTGGTQKAEKINKNLAKAAEELGIAMGVGSQRAALVDSELEHTYKVRDVAPDISLFGNIGLVQFINDFDISYAEKAVKMIDADGLFIHINPLQEIHQKEGDTDWVGGYEALTELCKTTKFPIIVKECGGGISSKVAHMIESAGADAIDINGSGGTSWAFVDASNSGKKVIDISIPTAFSLYEVKNTVQIPVIAGGGIRTGLDIAKSIAMGAKAVSIALPLLKPATRSSGAVVEKIQELINDLKTTMFLVGAKSIKELQNTDIMFTGQLLEMIKNRQNQP